MRANQRAKAFWMGVGVLLAAGAAGAETQPESVLQGEALPPSAIGPVIIESWDTVQARQRAIDDNGPPAVAAPDHRGNWVVPKMRAAKSPRSGTRYVTNTWGDPRMGIGFGGEVHLRGAYFSGQSSDAVWSAGVRAIGFRNGREIAATDWFTEIGDQPRWFEMDLRGIDRVVIESRGKLRGGGWYAMDDFVYSTADRPDRPVVLDFEDAEFGRNLSKTGYAGLTWETGVGGMQAGDGGEGVPAPQRAHTDDDPPVAEQGAGGGPEGGGGTLPQLGLNFQGVLRGDAGQASFPPDTCGAIGPNHFVVVVNRVFAVFNKNTGALVGSKVSLGTFQPGTSGDPRVLFDQHSGRWVVISSDFNSRIFVAFSQTNDPTGNWLKTNFVASTGSDTGCFPDYPTLGVDQNGIYVGSFMVGCGMTIFAIDKAPMLPLIGPTLGTVTAFRGQPVEGAIQPVHTYGSPAGEFLISRQSSTQLRVRRVNPPLNAPTLSTLSSVTIPSHSAPPNVPAQGSAVPLDSVDHRLMNAVLVNGSIWTTHTISVGGRAACRWYQINATTVTLTQSGTVDDPVRNYFFPAIAVNSLGDMVLGFSGAHSGQFPSVYYTGRVASDPVGQTAPPALIKAGNAGQDLIDDVGRNRFGDYSLSSLDPSNLVTIWTVQEYVHSPNTWGTWVARTVPFVDCNTNGLNDPDEIIAGTAEDCNGNNIPDPCDVNPILCGGNCLPDCNTNLVIDECDVLGGTSLDCDFDLIPNECEPDCNANGVPDTCDTVPLYCGGSCLQDCNANEKPDVCEVDPMFCGMICLPDCDSDGIPNSCEIFAGSQDCDGNSVPDECQTDCNGNGLADICETIPLFTTQATFSPFHFGSPQSLTLINPPPASADVTITFRAISDLGSIVEGTEAFLNGNSIGMPFTAGGSDCPPAPDVEAIVLPAATFNGIVGGGNAVISIVPNGGVDPTCPGSSVTIQVLYPTPDRDCNNNDVLDTCDEVIFIDVLLGVNTNPADQCVADRNGDTLANGDDVQVYINERISP